MKTEHFYFDEIFEQAKALDAKKITPLTHPLVQQFIEYTKHYEDEQDFLKDLALSMRKLEEE